MKITETIERECCHPSKDLKAAYNDVIINSNHKLPRKFCIHCGTRWEWVRKPGEMDYGWEKIQEN